MFHNLHTVQAVLQEAAADGAIGRMLPRECMYTINIYT